MQGGPPCTPLSFAPAAGLFLSPAACGAQAPGDGARREPPTAKTSPPGGSPTAKAAHYAAGSIDAQGEVKSDLPSRGATATGPQAAVVNEYLASRRAGLFQHNSELLVMLTI